MNGGSIHTCTSVEAGLAAELPYSQCQSASSLSSEPPLCRNEPRVRVEERRLKTEANLNSANPSLFTSFHSPGVERALVTQAIVIKQVSSPSTASRYVSQMGGVSAAPSNSLRFVLQVKAGNHTARRKVFVPT